MNKVISVGGAWFSGSSAVVDWLGDHVGTFYWPGTEFKFLSADIGFQWLCVNQCSSAEEVEMYFRTLSDLDQLVSNSNMKKFGSKDVKAVERLLRSNRFSDQWVSSLGVVKARALEGLRERGVVDSNVVQSAWEVFFSFLLGSSKGVQRVVLNQAPNISRLEILKYLPKLKYLAVLRDPRDQYIDILENRQKRGKPLISASKFIYGQKRRHRVLATASNSSSDHEVIVLKFEEFVLDSGFRYNLAFDLGLLGVNRVGEKFDAEASVKNVGIFRRYPDLKPDLDNISNVLSEDRRNLGLPF